MASSTVNYGHACMLKHHGMMRLARGLVDQFAAQMNLFV